MTAEERAVTAVAVFVMASLLMAILLVLSSHLPPCSRPIPVDEVPEYSDPVDYPPVECAQMSPDQLFDLVLRIAAAGVIVELPCIEVIP